MIFKDITNAQIKQQELFKAASREKHNKNEALYKLFIFACSKITTTFDYNNARRALAAEETGPWLGKKTLEAFLTRAIKEQKLRRLKPNVYQYNVEKAE